MKNLISVLIISLFFVSCKNSNDKIEYLKTTEVNNKIEFDSLRINAINNIVDAIIIQDSLDVLKSEKDLSCFLEKLTKLKIISPAKEKEGKGIVPLPFFNNVKSEYLINQKLNNKLFFSANDSSSIISQNLYPENLKLEKRILSKINSISSENAESQYKKESINLYEMSVPIFSLDNKKVYVQLNYYCGSLCGEGKEIFLEKLNGKWKIIYKKITWRS